MEVVTTCPLGSVCEEAQDNVIKRCAWYCKVVGKDPQSTKVYDEWRCSLGWLPVLLLENAGSNRGQTEAIEVFRNATLKRQDALNQIVATAANKRLE